MLTGKLVNILDQRKHSDIMDQQIVKLQKPFWKSSLYDSKSWRLEMKYLGAELPPQASERDDSYVLERENNCVENLEAGLSIKLSVAWSID